MEGERYGNERILFEEEEPPPSKPLGGGCNFVLSTQHSSLESNDKEEIESDEDVHKWGGAPGRLTSHDVARAIDGGKKVKLGFFGPNPYPGGM